MIESSIFKKSISLRHLTPRTRWYYIQRLISEREQEQITFDKLLVARAELRKQFNIL
jgi:hypothetical protein